MWGAMKYHAAHLADFGGRDARQTFWYWFLFLFLLNMAIGLLMSVPMTMSAMATSMAAARGGDPAAAQAAMMSQMAESIRPMIMVGIVLGLINIALIAASFVRRLHDSGKSGLWAAFAGLIYLGTLAMSWASADEVVAMMRHAAASGSAHPGMAMPAQLGWQSVIGYVPIVIVIVFGVMKSDPGANRYGEAPVRF